MLWENPLFQIPDGEAKRRGVTARDVDPRELARGTEHELEHTTSRRIARQIALDHISEDEDYYRKLAKMEKGLCRNPLRVGDRVRVKSAPHMRGQSTGTVREADGTAYAVQFDGSKKVHRWYVEKELERLPASNPGIEEALLLAALGGGALGFKKKRGGVFESFTPYAPNPLSELWASSKDRYRASAAEKRMYGGSTVTEFYVGKKGDEDDASKWVVQVGYGKTPGERKTDAIRRAAPRLGVMP